MPHIHQRKYPSHFHKVKRLNRHVEQKLIHKLPSNLIDENLLNKTSKYIKYFDYSLPELLSDHSTDPLQNTTRQYIDTKTKCSNQGRFANHEMIIRRNGETTILRPRRDLVLANGFTPVIRPSSLLPSYQSIMSHSQVASSLSIMNKMSMKKPEQPSIIKAKRKDRHQRKRCNETFTEQNTFHDYNFSNDHSHEVNFIHLVKQTLHNIMEERKYNAPQPVPLMSIQPQFPVPSYNQSFTPPPPLLEKVYFNQNPIAPPCFNERPFIPPNNRYQESFYDYPPKPNPHLQFPFPQQEHICSQASMSHQRNYSHMPDYFFD